MLNIYQGQTFFYILFRIREVTKISIIAFDVFYFFTFCFFIIVFMLFKGNAHVLNDVCYLNIQPVLQPNEKL